MKNVWLVIVVVFICALLLSGGLIAGNGSLQRERLLMDSGWRFALGNVCDTKKDFNHGTSYFSYFTKSGYGDGPAAKSFDDRPWRVIDLPHDWAVELPFVPRGGYSHGYKAIGRNFPENSIGWYRKTFSIPGSDQGRRISIEFDGVHRDATVWVNGFYLGVEHSGYYNFEYDITDYLNYGGENVVAVRVDATMEEGWYYEGAGIYRHVWLKKTSPLHVVPYGTFITSTVGEHSARITASVTLKNEYTDRMQFRINQSIDNPEGGIAAGTLIDQCVLEPGEAKEFTGMMTIPNPSLWSPETPSLYTMVMTVIAGDSTADRVETTFGIRTFRFDAKEGFFLNGKHYLLKGTNNHQDHAGVGTAIPDALQEFRIRKLKEMGSNAYRCSHNPPTPELLDACDQLGMLVIDENRLLGTTEEHLDLLKRMILRDRNHPSVFVWSIGNEEWAIEGNVTGARIAATMQDFTRRLDSTRRVTYASSGWGSNGISTVQDIMGFNYIFNGDIDKQHREFPNQPSMGTEETTSRQTRGIYKDDTARGYQEPIDRKPTRHGCEEGLIFYAARPFLGGLFFWTGFDHRGEPNPYGWPQVSSQCGIVDQCGFPKDMFYYILSWWTDRPVLHVTPHWNRTGSEGDTIDVRAYSNSEEVDLSLNGKSLGRKTVVKNSHCEWRVPYKAGTLVARGYKDGKVVVTDQVSTTGEAASLALSADRSSIRGDGEDISVVTVQIDDAKGRMVPNADEKIGFTIQGPGKIIGVGNGDPSSHDPDRFIENVEQVQIMDLKARIVPRGGESVETGAEVDDSSWRPALSTTGEYNVRIPDTLSVAVIRGRFTLPMLTDSSLVSLWPKSMGEIQTVFVNGHQIVTGIRRDDPVQRYILGHGILREGMNSYTVVCKPLVPRFLYDNLNVDPGIIGILTPAMQWERKAFNGLAQVIIQSTKTPGTITLTASSPGLTAAKIQIRVDPATPRSAVP